MTISVYAQPPHCDTCVYDYDHIRKGYVVDSVVPYTPPQILTEFKPCAEGTIKQKNITFVHGLGGGVSSWAKQAVWTDDNYKSSFTIAEYTGADWEDTLHLVAKKLSDDIGAGIYHNVDKSYPNRCPDDDFAIAHSQGGIAARYLDRQWDVNTNGSFGVRKFRGLVTFGTPHSGAEIALTRKQHAAFVNQVIHTIYLKNVYDLRGWSGKLDKLLDSVKVFTEEKLVPALLGGVTTPTLDEMRPDNQTMINLNNHQSRLRKVAFYGVEQAPECWRIMSNMVDVAAEKYPIWTATNDDFFIKKAQEALDNHIGEINANTRKIKRNNTIITASNTVFKLMPGGWFFLPATIATHIVLIIQNNRLDGENQERNKAVTFLDNANTEWRYLIGSYHIDSFDIVTETKHKVTWREKYSFLSRWYSQERDGFNEKSDAEAYFKNINVYKTDNMQLSTYTVTNKTLKFFPSDGIILVKSQKAFPGVGDRTDAMPGDNHFQMRNSPETERVMKLLYDGFYDPFFYTAR